MKKTIGVLATYAGAAVLAGCFATVSEVKAQTTTPSPAPAAAQGPCSAEAKLAVYNEFREIFKTNQAKAYDLAQKYLACPTNPGEESIATYLKEKFVAPIDKARRAPKVSALVYEAKDYAKAFELGRQILAEEPENLRMLIDLGYGGYAAMTAKNDSFSNEALGYVRKAIQAIEAGKAPESWAPYKSKEDTLTYLYNALAHFTLKTNPSEALAQLIKAAQFESELKKDPWTYFFIAAAYEAGPYTKLSADYKARFEGKDESPESKLALENINQVVDRMVDAYARAVALAGTDPKHAAKKTEWMDSLTTWYKYRHKDSDAGLKEMIAGVMSKPLPPEPKPITTLPAATPASTPTSGAAPGAGNEVAPATTTAPKTTTSATTTGTTVKPKPKNNHPKPVTRRN
jgi:hypothetical protein